MRGVGRHVGRLFLVGSFTLVLTLSGVLPTTISTTTRSAQSGELIVTAPAAVPDGPDHKRPLDRPRGLVFRGLKHDAVRCRGGLALSNGSTMCSHGPDRAPPGVDVTRARSTSDLIAATEELCGPAGCSETTTPSGSIPCYGDGVSGKRVQVVYAHAADVADRYGDLASSLTQWVANVDRTFNDSAAETGGIRHVRWVTDDQCNLTVQRVRLSSTGDDTFTGMISELRSVGLTRTDRKYLVWADARVYCGIANMYRDDSPGLTNLNNGGPMYGRTDTGCWGGTRSVEAHELMHLLGGVQYTAPHSSGGAHCTDAYDRMCYADSTSVQLTYPCALTAHARLFDCNHDDYFTTKPSVGSYLATHWNTASSSFLEAVDPVAPAPTPTTSPSPSPSTSSSPSPTPSPSLSPSPTPSPTPSPGTTTTTFTGSLRGKASSVSYTITVGSGPLRVVLTSSKASSLTITVRAPDGTIVASQKATSPLTITVSEGTYAIVVSGRNASFKLSATYADP
jgi:hypothetical protein